MNSESESPQKDIQIFFWVTGVLAVALAALVLVLMIRSEPKPDVAAPDQRLKEFVLTERSGATVSRASLSNRILVVSFVHTGCSFSCRAVSKQMVDIQKRLETDKDVRLLSLTIDPRTDTPTVLKEFADSIGANQEWLFLTGEKPAVYDLIEGSFLKRETNMAPSDIPGEFAGVEQIVVVDQMGKIRKFFNGLKRNSVEAVMETVQQLRRENPVVIASSPATATNAVRRFPTQGVVREVPEGGQTLVVRHEEIPGYMPKMVMELTVKNTNEIQSIKVGDEIAFDLVVNEEDHHIEKIRRIGGTAETNAPPAVTSFAELRPGDLMPDAALTDEEGKAMQFSDFRGKALAFSFIFTRCPLPDFCPRMNNYFKDARKILQANQNGATNWMLLSLSFDPDFDKPAILKGYARSYRGDNRDRWMFASASSLALMDLGPQLDFRYAKEAGTFSHNLRTVVLDTGGRIYRQFDGNKWTAQELAEAIQQATGK